MQRRTGRSYLNMQKILSIVIICACLFPAAAPPVYGDENAVEIEKPGEDSGIMAMGLMFFRKTISRADGRRCMMFPSCSHYSGQAFEKHGFIKGWVMTSDRLLRCGRDEKHLSEQIVIRENVFVFDPLEHNDFWWSRP